MHTIMLTWFLLLLLAVQVSAAEDVVAAKVDETVFTLRDVEAEVDRLIPRMTFHRNVSPEKRKHYYGKAIDELINRELQYRDAKASGLTIAKEQIDAHLAKFKKRFASEKDYLSALEREHTTEDLVRARIERELLAQAAYEKNVTNQAKISDAALEEYYAKNTARFKEPESVKLRIISTKDEAKARDILAKIQAGEDFGDLAYRFSEDSYRVKGGDLGYVHRGRMLAEIEKVAFSSKIGEVSDVIKDEATYFIIKVEDRKPEHQLTFPEVREKLRKELESQRVEELRTKWIESLRAKAKIEVLLKLD